MFLQYLSSPFLIAARPIPNIPLVPCNVDLLLPTRVGKCRSDNSLGDLRPIRKVERASLKLVVIVFLVSDVVVQREIVCVRVQIGQYGPIPADPVNTGPEV